MGEDAEVAPCEPRSAPTSRRRRRRPTHELQERRSLFVWALLAAGSVATFLIQEWLRDKEDKAVERDNDAVRDEWRRDTCARLDQLIGRNHAADDDESPLFGRVQTSAFLDVILGALWPDLMRPILSALAPGVVEGVLAAYLEARDIVPVPSFITALKVKSVDAGGRCPFGIRGVRVSPKGALPDGGLVVDMDIELLSSDMVVISAWLLLHSFFLF